MNFSYPKSEKLKSKKTIDLLFSKGKSVSKYPLRLVYIECDFDTAESRDFGTDQKIKMGVSVSKKYFPCYRTNNVIKLRKNRLSFVIPTKEESHMLLTLCDFS